MIVYSLIAINRGPMRPLVDVAVDTPIPEPLELLIIDSEALMIDGEALVI